MYMHDKNGVSAVSISEDKIRESIVTDFEHNMFIEAGAGR